MEPRQREGYFQAHPAVGIAPVAAVYDRHAISHATLAVGEVTEQIRVEAGAALVETQTTAVGQVVDNQRVLALY